MSGFIEGEDRRQATLFPERLDGYIAEDSAVRVIDVFIDDLDLSGLAFKTEPNDTGRPAYHPATFFFHSMCHRGSPGLPNRADFCCQFLRQYGYLHPALLV